MYTMEYYSATKENEIMLFAGKWMELEIILLHEIRQPQKDKYVFSQMQNLDLEKDMKAEGGLLKRKDKRERDGGYD
jgi:hypothetical protein